MDGQNSVDQKLLDEVLVLCRQAGRAILEVYHRPDAIEVTSKADASPVTEADYASHGILTPGLEKLLDAVPVLSEEGNQVPYEVRGHWRRYWLIDPLDGTKEFISRNGEFTVNVALVEDGVPILGVVYVPVMDLAYLGLRGEGRNKGAWKQDSTGRVRICTRALADIPPSDKVAVVASRRHGAEAVGRLLTRLEERFGLVETRSMGSSLKLCLVAEGKADLYPRLAPTSEWDTAAAQAVVEGAGGQVLSESMKILRYNMRETLLNPFFYVIGDPAYDWRSLLVDQSSPITSYN